MSQDPTTLIAALEKRLDATNGLLDFALDLLGLGDLASSCFSSEELKDAGGVLPAYLHRRGAVCRVDLQRILTGIQPLDRDDRRRIDPTFPRTLGGMAPRAIADVQETSERIFTHTAHAESPAPARQAVVMTVPALANLLRELTARANDPALRFYGEDDAAMSAKLSLADALCEPLWMDDRLSETEEIDLRLAKDAADQAWSRLQDRAAATTAA